MTGSLQALIARERPSLFESLVGSTLCIVVPTLVRLGMTSALGKALPFATYFPAVLLATLLWGTGWGAMVLSVSGMVAGYLFVQSENVELLGAKGLTSLALFLVSGALILVTGEVLRRALTSLQASQEAEVARKAELQHRLKNTLSIVQSFSFILSRRLTDTAEFHRLLEDRLSALGKANEVLFAEKFESCALPETADAALAPFVDDKRLMVVGPRVTLAPACCEPLILALHELATNAHKYGALSVPQGSIKLTWTISSSDPTNCIIRWTEKNGPLVKRPVRAGLGQRLLRRQAGLNDVKLSYEPAGVICELTVPLAK